MSNYVHPQVARNRIDVFGYKKTCGQEINFSLTYIVFLYHHELDDLRTHLPFTQATGEVGEQLDLLQKDVQAREVSQMQLKDIVIRIETDIMDEVAKAFEIATLRGEIRILSTHWMNKTKNLKSQLKKHKRTDQELKKRVLKLEFCLRSCHPLILLCALVTTIENMNLGAWRGGAPTVAHLFLYVQFLEKATCTNSALGSVVG
ncbi:hypothetical protein ZEAMMB73_Zm00001d003367 [Zea mays]|uniref:Uncharacterized protein n=1 Tax=Zea mays TaxID=4577 RepID=A0A1D6E8T8_MAIZE|nr:hypothetical protein ZEAMMB73_Zm00001d003367 [Zea mays]ONM16819.1 hypothetical protein ZEAMMB73_Zm00001d003367 [Zea mays]ONM16820.1 hypothetical protein ZEAMMB73_Zm00001d003367 [Zea mays]ONM16821.1 hypothetical protein ZEAMMB73_Zm00001d003367 [Zea mays]